MFHLSLPVTEFQDCLRFYRTCFGARIEMLNEKAANLYVFGAQLTFHDRPDSAIEKDQRQEMHFGYVVTDEEWLLLKEHIQASGRPILSCVEPRKAAGVRGKLLVVDPSGNIVEINSRLQAPAVAEQSREASLLNR